MNEHRVNILKFIYTKVIIYFLLLFSPAFAISQVEQKMLLSDVEVQIESLEAVNDLYNFKFDKAEQQFRWLKQKYAWHPLPYFLLGLSEWWKIMPNINNKQYDKKFLAYMDTTIVFGERLFKEEKYKVEAAFFLAAAHGFKGRFYSSEERKYWKKATVSGKSALNYLKISKGQHSLSPELLFGDALYNYFSVWIPENYPFLKLILAFFPEGDKKLGLQQLREVSRFAFYTRTEAQVFLMQILNNYENNRPEALQIGKYLHKTYPDNAYFHRYYARLLYSSGNYSSCEQVSKNIFTKIDSGMVGYEANSGRYASFFLGQVYQFRKDYHQAAIYYKKTIKYAEEIEALKSGYYLYALLYLGKIQWDSGDQKAAKSNFKKIRKYTKRSHKVNKDARKIMKN